jgi:hypothetical protein
LQAIVHGVNGVLYWGLSANPPGAPVWADLKAVAAELRQMKDALAHPAKIDLRLEYHDTGHSLDRGIEWTARRGREGGFLIAVNADPNPVDVTFSGGFNRREVFAPFDTRVYPLPSGRV